jgi:hypothetical protein
MIIGVVLFEILFSAGAGGGENMISNMSQQVMANGFKIAYYAGAGILFAGFIFCFAIPGRGSEKNRLRAS